MLVEHYDVVIIGAGLSGIGAAVHLGRDCPERSLALFESRDDIGGTWDLFRYPGIRSDSDMLTLGYNFKPWMSEQTIADGSLIKDYIESTADEYRVKEKIQFGQRVTAAEWCSDKQSWMLEITDQKNGERKNVIANFVMACTGYYNYQSGYEPNFSGKEDFEGEIVHPQHWPEDLDYRDKRVVIIGSGATAVTLAPAMAPIAGQVTILQRSPSYVMTRPKVDEKLKEWKSRFSAKNYYRLARIKNVASQFFNYQYCRFFPNRAKQMIHDHVSESIGSETDMKHFTPRYNPWDERVCAVTDGDLFHSVRDGQVVMETDHIERFTKDGILLKSGKQLEADIIITATGLNLQMMGGMSLTVDGKPFDYTQKMCYRDVLLQDLPNMGFVFGYTNASWTLKADLVMTYIGRVLNYMNKKNAKVVVPRNTNGDPGGLPFSDMQSGYIMRARDKMPKRGKRIPWRLFQNYPLDSLMLRYTPINDGKLEFIPKQEPVSESVEAVTAPMS